MEVLRELFLVTAAIGLTHVVTMSTLTAPLRRWTREKREDWFPYFSLGRAVFELFADLLECNQCLGFWVGLGVSGFSMLPMNVIFRALCFGFVVSFLARRFE